MKAFKKDQLVYVTLAGEYQIVKVAHSSRVNSKQVCVKPVGKEFKGQLSFMPFAHMSPTDLESV